MAPPRPDGTGDWLEAGATGGMGLEFEKLNTMRYYLTSEELTH